jgi:hypothetical protein
LSALDGVARIKTLLRVDAANESRRNTLLEAEQDEADELFAATVWHCCSGKFIVYCGVHTDRCSSAELFILKNPVGIGVVDGGVVGTVVIAEDGQWCHPARIKSPVQVEADGGRKFEFKDVSWTSGIMSDQRRLLLKAQSLAVCLFSTIWLLNAE